MLDDQRKRLVRKFYDREGVSPEMGKNDHRALNQDAILEAVSMIVRLSGEVDSTTIEDCKLRFTRADWFLHLRSMLEWGELGDILEEINISPGLAKQEIWMARKWPKDERRPDILGWAHHRMLATKSKATRDAVITQAERTGRGDPRDGGSGTMNPTEIAEIINEMEPEYKGEEPNFLEQTRIEYIMTLVRREYGISVIRRTSEHFVRSLVEDALRWSTDYSRAKGTPLEKDIVPADEILSHDQVH